MVRPINLRVRNSVVGEAMLGTTVQKVLHISEISVLVARIRNDEAGKI